MPCEVIDCSDLFNAIKEKRNRFYLANTILMLDVSYKTKIRLAQKLIEEEDGFDWFMEQLEEDQNNAG